MLLQDRSEFHAKSRQWTRCCTESSMISKTLRQNNLVAEALPFGGGRTYFWPNLVACIPPQLIEAMFQSDVCHI